MENNQQGILIRIFINETTSYKGNNLTDVIVQKAKESKMAGATVIRGIMGYQGTHDIHISRILRLSDDLPVIIEIVDTQEKVEAFLPFLDKIVNDGLITTEKVNIFLNRNKNIN